MRILVTGATGVIGRRTVPLLLHHGHAVTAAGRSPDRLRALASLGARTARIDLFDRDSVMRVVDGHEVVINLATHVPPSDVRMLLPGAWSEMARIRQHASVLLADAAIARDVALFVQESFAPIYEDAGDRWIGEGAAVRPVRYNRSTLIAEASAERVAEGGARGVILRFAYFYGPDDDFTRAVAGSAQKGWLPLLGRSEGYFSTVNHDDAAMAVVSVLDAPSGIYNVVDNDPLTRRELAELASDVLHVPVPRIPPAWLAKLAGGVGETMSRSLRISNAKLRALAHWPPASASARDAWRDALETTVKQPVGVVAR
jgi:nucleoside-diphosphate-sugar epimerase